MNTLRRIAIAVALTFAMTGAAVVIEGCAGLTGVQGAQLAADKGLYLAELAYSGFAQSVIAGKAAGVLTGAKLTAAKAADAKAYAALLKARAGVGSANAVLDILKSVQGLVPIGSVGPLTLDAEPRPALRSCDTMRPDTCLSSWPITQTTPALSIDSILARSHP